MSRKPKLPPPRRPHPDPRVEAELQRVISLRAAIARAEQMADAAAQEAADADRRSAKISSYGRADCNAYAAAAARHRETIAQTEEKIIALHDEIAKRIAALRDDDLLWLGDPA